MRIRKPLASRWLFPAIVFLVGAGLTLLAGLRIGFHVTENDFWGVLYYGQNLSLENPASLYNGFYPIGYAFLIGQLPSRYVVEFSYILNALLAGLFVAALVDLVAAGGSIPATLLALICTLTLPLAVHYSNTVGPDIGAAAFTAAGVHLLWRDRIAGRNTALPPARYLFSGMFLGLAFLWRSHAGVSSVVILVLALLANGSRPPRAALALIASFFGLVAIQLAVNLASGHALFETSQKFNVYKLLYGVNWNAPPSPDVIDSFAPLRNLVSQPQDFLRAFLPPFYSLALLALPAVACGLLAPPRSGIRWFGWFAALGTLLYAFPLALGDSPRAPLTIMSLVLGPLFLSAALILGRLRAVRSAPRLAYPALATAMLLAGMYTAAGWLRADLSFLDSNAAQHRNFLEIQETLMEVGLTSADQVYSNKFQFYLPDVPPFIPRQIGGWAPEWLWGYSDQYPSLPNDSWQAFASACRAQGIRFLVLSPASPDQGRFFGYIYDRAYEEDLLGLEFIGLVARMRMYRFTDAGESLSLPPA